MDLSFLERLLELVGRAPIGELELGQDGWRVRIVKAAQPDAAGTSTGGPATPQAERSAERVHPTAPAAEPEAHVIEAGLVGTFYRRPAPDKPPFVEVGDAVSDGQTLGIVEAMKTLIPVQADRDGRVAAVLQEDGAPVGAGEALFRIALDRP